MNKTGVLVIPTDNYRRTRLLYSESLIPAWEDDGCLAV